MRGNVIRVSGPDAHSPLSWSILAHEFGHAIETEYQLSADLDGRTAGRFAKLNPHLRSIVESHYRELIADAIAAHAMGLARSLR